MVLPLGRPPPSAQRALVKWARLGFFVKGVLELGFGTLALLAALHLRGGRITDSDGALRTIRDAPFGDALLIAAAIGLGGYAVWWLVRAIWDPDHPGERGLRPTGRRLGYALAALLHAALATAAVQIVVGNSIGDGEARTWIGRLVAHDLGRFGLLAIGIGVILYGIGHAIYGARARFRKYFDEREHRWAVAFGRVGFVARGVVLLVIGIGLVRAGLHARAAEYRDLGDALRAIASQEHGMIWLALIAAGLALHGLYLIASSRVRRIRT